MSPPPPPWYPWNPWPRAPWCRRVRWMPTDKDRPVTCDLWLSYTARDASPRAGPGVRLLSWSEVRIMSCKDWPLIGQDWSPDLNNDVWYVQVSMGFQEFAPYLTCPCPVRAGASVTRVTAQAGLRLMSRPDTSPHWPCPLFSSSLCPSQLWIWWRWQMCQGPLSPRSRWPG